MASKTPDGASDKDTLPSCNALYNMLRLAEEMHHLVEPGRKELEYMTEEQVTCKTLIKELLTGQEALKDKLRNQETDSVSNEKYTQLISKYQKLASEAKEQLTEQKRRLHSLEKTSAEGEKQVELLHREVSKANEREEQLKKLLEQKEREWVRAKRETEEIRLNGINKTNSSGNNRRVFDDLAEATNREAELNTQVTKLRKRLSDVETELNEIKTRLSRTMGDKLTDNNPSITELSEKNRPVKLAERYSELYDNEWTDAFELINKVYRDERNTVAQLLKILMLTQLPKPVEKQLKDCRKVMAENAGGTLYERYVAKLRQSPSSVARDALNVTAFLKKAFTLCWLMCVQDPPVVFDEPPKHGDTLKSEVYKSYARGGQYVDFLVWPALLLHEAGPVLCRGVAQGFQHSLGELPNGKDSLRRLPGVPERSQELKVGMINQTITPSNDRKVTTNKDSPNEKNGPGGSLRLRPTHRVTLSRDSDQLVSGKRRDIPEVTYISGSERAKLLSSDKPPNASAVRPQTTSTSRKNEIQNDVDTLPKVNRTSGVENDILDVTNKDINDFFNLLREHNYSYSAVQRAMDKSKFDACYRIIKTHYG